MDSPTIELLGDTLLILRLGDVISDETSEKVAARAAAIRQSRIDGVSDVVASYTTVGIHFDPRSIAHDDLRERIASILGDDIGHAAAAPRIHRIKVRYDGDDLRDVAERTGLTADEVAGIHAATEYRVFVVGFVPGFAYLGVLDERLALPRRDTPRKRVPPGSVAIAERQTGVYPSATPGGWHIIGNTDETMFDPARNPPALLQVGDRVRFVT
jgi:KipI family sensor histidine kinase inhibitor